MSKKRKTMSKEADAALEALAKADPGNEEEYAEAQIRALNQAAEHLTKEQLDEMVNSEHIKVQRVVAELAAPRLTPIQIDAVIENGDWSAREQLVINIGKQLNKGQKKTLAGDKDDWVRQAVAEYLFMSLDPEQQDDLIQDEDHGVKEILARVWGKDGLTAKQLITLLRDGTPRVRRAAQKAARERVQMASIPEPINNANLSSALSSAEEIKTDTGPEGPTPSL